VEDWQSYEVGDSGNFEEEVELTGQNQELMDFLVERQRNTSRIPLVNVKEELGLE
jgi:hypothetical protein